MRKPANTDFSQQRLTAISPKLDINGMIMIFFIIGVIFTPLGIMLLFTSMRVVLIKKVYDAAEGMDIDCHIKEANVGGNCTVMIIEYHIYIYVHIYIIS
jgi:hypothetical protein